MSRLDSVIRRLQAQRACIGATLARAPAGPVLEIGLGNGRTYDHLREHAGDRDIWVIEREPAAHPDSMPPPERLLVGEAAATIEALAARLGPTVAVVHYDLGIGVPEEDGPTAAGVAAALPALLAPGALVAANCALPGFAEAGTPPEVPEGRYHVLSRA